MSERDGYDLPPEEEELLQRLVRGDLDDSESVQDPRLRRILALQRSLDAVGGLGTVGRERAAAVTASGSAGASLRLVGDSAVADDDSAAEQRVERLARRRLEAPASSFAGRPHGATRILFGLAAVALLGLSLWLALGGDGRRVVGTEEEYELDAFGEVEVRWERPADEASRLTADVATRLGAEYTFRAYAADPRAGGALLAVSEGLDVPSWSPAGDHAPDETPVSSWPETVWIQLEEFRSTSGQRELLYDAALGDR